MTTKFLAFGGASVLAAVAVASTAVAQARAPAAARPAAAPAASVTHGAPIPGLCILSVNQAISASTVGQYVSQRMNQIVSSG